MNVTRIYTGPDNQSHFEDLKLPLLESQFGHMSKQIPVEWAVFRETDARYSLDFHVAPRRQFVVTIRGAAEIECGDGTVRRLGPGSILLAEDTTGQGHISREVESPRHTIFLPIPEDFDISTWR